MKYIYYIDGEKFTSDNLDEIPHYDISSPNENTPAYEELETGVKIWCKKKWVIHRLSGPGIIDKDGNERFYLNGEFYIDNVILWLKHHPNQDNTFQVEMLLKYT